MERSKMEPVPRVVIMDKIDDIFLFVHEGNEQCDITTCPRRCTKEHKLGLNTAIVWAAAMDTLTLLQNDFTKVIAYADYEIAAYIAILSLHHEQYGQELVLLEDLQKAIRIGGEFIC